MSRYHTCPRCGDYVEYEGAYGYYCEYCGVYYEEDELK